MARETTAHVREGVKHLKWVEQLMLMVKSFRSEERFTNFDLEVEKSPTES